MSADRSVLALEICVELAPAPDRMHARLTRLAQQHEMTRPALAEWLRDFSRTVLTLRPNWRRGIWDFFDDNEKANTVFWDYANTIRDKKGARGGPAVLGRLGPMRSQTGPFYFTSTLALRLVNGHVGERAIAETCNVHESKLWSEDTFVGILRALPAVSPACIESLVSYVIPRDDGYALTAQDIDHPDFAYLRTIHRR
jgi:hypothetical protein